MSTAVATLPEQPPRKQDIRVVDDVIPVLDTARFEQMQRIANVMAHSSLIPDSLCKVKDPNSNDKNKLVPLSPQEIISNCFLIVNQAVRWGMDPFAVGQCVSVVHGKLCYEGKLIAAVIDAKLGIKLEYDITGEGDKMKVVVRGAINGQPVKDSMGKIKTVEGTVAEWKTTHPGSPWSATGGYPRMLRYRGAREWGRVHAPSLMLGVYSEDEMEELSDNRRAMGARDVTPPKPPVPPAPPPVAAIEQEPEAEAPPAPEPVAEEIQKPKTTRRDRQHAADAETKAKDGMPDPDADPNGFLKWLEERCAGIQNGTALETFWNTTVDPMMEKMFPPDVEEAMGIYRRHEARLQP